jgi:hypothetical protein
MTLGDFNAISQENGNGSERHSLLEQLDGERISEPSTSAAFLA